MSIILNTYERHVAHWVMRLLDEKQSAQRSILSVALQRLLALGPHVDSDGELPDWLTVALQQIIEEIRHFTPPDHPPLAWHFLIITHRLVRAQATAYRMAMNRPHYPPCPFTIHQCSTTSQRRRRERSAVELPGLGLMLAGYWMPPESHLILQNARDAGIDWCQADAFEHLLNPVQQHLPVAQHKEAVQTVEPPRSPTPPTTTASAPDQADQPSCTQTETALRCALIDSVRHLCDHPPCNRNGSAAWVTVDTVWVIARRLAEQMIGHPALQPHNHLKQRTALYRALVSHGLALSDSDGKRPIWKITLSFGAHHQRADALRIARHLIWPDGAAPPSIPSESVSLDRRSMSQN